MFRCFWSALQARRAAVHDAEVLVFRFGSRGVAMARTFAQDTAASEARRRHYRRVAHIAERRHLDMASLDTATRYAEVARWQRRHGTRDRGVQVVS